MVYILGNKKWWLFFSLQQGKIGCTYSVTQKSGIKSDLTRQKQIIVKLN